MNQGDDNGNEHQKDKKRTNQQGLDFKEINNKQSLIKCTYYIKDLKETHQIINNSYEGYINKDIESKVKIFNDNKKEKLF